VFTGSFICLTCIVKLNFLFTGDVLVHIMTPMVMKFYKLDELGEVCWRNRFGHTCYVMIGDVAEYRRV
jgi:hypothetical protein